MLPGTARRYWVQWLLLGIGLLAFGALIGYSLYLEHSRVDALERDRLQVQARIVDESLSRQIEGVDNALAGVRDEFPPPVDKSTAKEASRHLKALSDAMPGVRTMLLVDGEGTVLASSRDEFLGLNFSEREYFTVPRERPDPAMLYVSPPFRTVLGVYSINVVRVVTGSRGQFAGIVSATLDPDYFNFVLHSVLYAPDMWVSIAHGDGMGFLYMPPNEQAAGIDLAKFGSFFHRHRESGKAATVMTGTFFATGDERMMAVRTIRPDYVPMDKALVVGVSRDISAIYARWRNDVFMTGALYGAFVLTTILALNFAQRRQMAHDRLEASYETERNRVARELQHKTELAQLLEQLARAANEAVSPEAAMDICLRRICEYGNWALGRVARYGPARPHHKAEHSQWFCADPARFGAFMRFSEDYGHDPIAGRFVGQVLRDRKPVWLPDLTVRDYSMRNRLGDAVKAGLKCAFAFPVIVGGDVVAILELLATETREPDTLLIEGTSGLASQFARMIERSRATESQAKLAAIVEHSNDAVIGRAVDGTVTSWNAAAERIFGYTAAEVVGRDPVEIIPPEARQQSAANRNLVRSGLSVPSHEVVRIARDGRRIDVTLSASPIRDNSGNIVGTASILCDISERKQAENALRASEQRYRGLFNNMLEGFSYCRMLFENGRPRDFVYIEVNPAFEKLTGLRNVVGKKASEVIPGIRESNPTLFERYGRVASTGKPETFEIYVGPLEEWFSISTFCPENGYFVAVFEIITERKAAEQKVRDYANNLRTLSRKLIEVQEDERKRLARELHDQIGQVLTALKINLQVIQRQPAAAPVASKIEECAQISDAALRQVRTLMLDLRPPQLDELGLAVALRTHAERVLTPANLALHFSAPGELPKTPPTIEITCFRIMQETLTNILRHAGARNVWIELAVAGNGLKLAVRDDGKGFDLAEAHRRAMDGGSIGLLSMEERAALADGRIEIVTEPGTGTTVQVVFSLQAAQVTAGAA